ncbi:MAG: flavocytochrome c, partial [Oscillospiraceae bacterium]|nr:flavocytochrome c [Oscillospiraceae bacterium]
ATGTGMGIDGEVQVQVVADESTIYSVEVVKQNETVGIGSIAVEQLPGAIVAANSYNVDGVSGATVTSTAIRDAVKMALESAGFDPEAYVAAAPAEGSAEEKAPVELNYDVVVVGAGGAGLTATVRATQEGAKVLLLEKMPFVGGNSLRAEGGMNAAGTKVEEELGLTDSTVENFISDTLRLGHDLADPELVRTLSENSAEAVDWLFSIDAPLTRVKATGGCEGRKYLHQPEDGSPVGEYLVSKLKTQIEKLGVDVRVNTKATEILMEDGRAVGVVAEDAEHVYTIRANAVVLATGGFGANFDLMASYDPSLANAVTTNQPGAQGDGIMMAEAVGADTVDMEQIQLHPTVIQSNGMLVSESFRSLGAIIVNTEGKRFVNDLAGRDVVSQAELKQPDGYCFIVFDQHLVDELALSQKFIEGGYTIEGDTYEALAENMGLTGEAVQNFVTTMETWNESVAKGVDEEWGRNNGMDDDLSVSPYYAIKIAPGIHHTMGGIKINPSAEVISTEGEVIPALFACGETTGGIHGGNRVGGNAVCDFIVFGRIAGQNAAAYAAGAEVAAPAEEEAPAEEAPAEEAAAPAAGEDGKVTVTGTGMGIDGEVQVQVVADESIIYSVEVVKQNETVGIGSIAVEQLPGAIVAANSYNVDGVSGATITSTAIRDAVKMALESAGFDPEAYVAAA